MNRRLTLLAVLFCVPLVLSAAGCSVEEVQNDLDTTKEGKGKKVTNRNWRTAFGSNGDGYDGASVRLVGSVYDKADGDTFLVSGDFENSEQPAKVNGDFSGITTTTTS